MNSLGPQIAGLLIVSACVQSFARSAKRCAIWMAAILGLLAAAAILLPVDGGRRPPVENTWARNDEFRIIGAVKSYYADYGYDTLPLDDRAAFVRALTGGNRRGIDYLELRAGPHKMTERLLDPWGHPYRIDFSDVDHPKVRSAGANGKYEESVLPSDDVCSWR